ncbi:MAG: hypothetical protein EAZ92_05495 [Candidatus Kapaibacterium sp.]|nr:MAG: hypothetical protein EAZ92_05495 [Candidatus Kapabacteria bacterium]
MRSLRSAVLALLLGIVHTPHNSLLVNAQPAQDTLYINLNTHAEESDRDPQGMTLNYSANQIQYTHYRALVKQIADMVRSKGAKWNYQSDWNFLDGGIKYDRGDASTNNKNLFRWMAEDNNGRIQLDPHAHETRYNYADVAKMLDSVSPVVKASKNVGGFTWNGPMAASSLMGMSVRGYTWDSLGKGLQGRVFRNYTWKAEVLLGGASYNPRTMMTSHGQDLNHAGAWRPRDTSTSGYKNHTCTAALANLGVGGDALINDSGDVASNVAAVMANIRATIAAMKANKGKFFVMQIQTNQRAFTRAGYMDKISRVIDSVNVLMRTERVQWATHSEKAATWKALYNEQPNFYPYTDGTDRCSTPPNRTMTLVHSSTSYPLNIAPNHASDAISIRFTLPRSEHIRLSATNIFGQEVALILDEQRSEGEHLIRFDTQNLPSGMVFIRLQSRTNSTIQAVQVIR